MIACAVRERKRPLEQTSDVEKARQFAIEAHGQQRYGDQPYVVHLEEVVEILHDFGTEARIVAYLHDVVEDTPVSLEEIDTEFGSLVARCVEVLTDEPGETRAQRKAKTHSDKAGEWHCAPNKKCCLCPHVHLLRAPNCRLKGDLRVTTLTIC